MKVSQIGATYFGNDASDADTFNSTGWYSPDNWGSHMDDTGYRINSNDEIAPDHTASAFNLDTWTKNDDAFGWSQPGGPSYNQDVYDETDRHVAGSEYNDIYGGHSHFDDQKVETFHNETYGALSIASHAMIEVEHFDSLSPYGEAHTTIVHIDMSRSLSWGDVQLGGWNLHAESSNSSNTNGTDLFGTPHDGKG